MSKKRKKRNLGPRRKRLKQPSRLQSAQTYIPSYQGKNIVQGYCKHYGVDLLCAIRELEMLGIAVSPEYVKAVKQCVEARALEKQRKKIKIQEELEGVYGVDYDEFFSYISGHTEVEHLMEFPGKSSYSIQKRINFYLTK